MEESKDKEIQRKLEDKEMSDASLNEAEQAAAASYQKLFQLLKNDPGEGFSLRFSKKIIQRIQAKQDRRFTYWTYLLSALVIVPGFAFIIFFLSADSLNPVVASVAQYRWVIIFVIILIFAMQFFDRKRVLELTN